jgi:hypothetical protein
MSREFRATTKNQYGNADLVYNRKALQIREKRLFTLLSIIVTDSVASKQSSKTSYIFLGCLAHLKACSAKSLIGYYLRWPILTLGPTPRWRSVRRGMLKKSKISRFIHHGHASHGRASLGVYLMSMHLIGVHLISMHLIGAHLISYVLSIRR